MPHRLVRYNLGPQHSCPHTEDEEEGPTGRDLDARGTAVRPRVASLNRQKDQRQIPAIPDPLARLSPTHLPG